MQKIAAIEEQARQRAEAQVLQSGCVVPVPRMRWYSAGAVFVCHPIRHASFERVYFRPERSRLSKLSRSSRSLRRPSGRERWQPRYGALT